MKTLGQLLGLLFLLAFCAILPSCEDKTVAEPDTEADWIIGEAQIKPASPTTRDEVKVISYDCRYYALASVTEKENEITIKRRFNGQLKWPCILVHDTVSLGKLKKGTYNLILLIVDTNPMAADSIFSKETMTIRVSG